MVNVVEEIYQCWNKKLNCVLGNVCLIHQELWPRMQQLVNTILTRSCFQQVKNTTHAVPRFRGAHVSQSGAPKGVPHRFQCYNTFAK